MPNGKKWSDPTILQATTIADADQFLIIQASTGQSKRITQQVLSSLTGNALTASLSLTPAQIKTLNSVPISIVSAPGAGKAIEVISASGNLVFVSARYTNFSDSINLIINSAATAQYSCSVFLNSLTNSFSLFNNGASKNSLVANQPLMVQSQSDYVVGDSPITIYVTYRIITL